MYGEEFETGEYTFTVLADATEGMVMLEFDEQISWIGLSTEEARRLAELLVRCADALEQPERMVN